MTSVGIAASTRPSDHPREDLTSSIPPPPSTTKSKNINGLPSEVSEPSLDCSTSSSARAIANLRQAALLMRGSDSTRPTLRTTLESLSTPTDDSSTPASIQTPSGAKAGPDLASEGDSTRKVRFNAVVMNGSEAMAITLSPSPSSSTLFSSLRISSRPKRRANYSLKRKASDLTAATWTPEVRQMLDDWITNKVNYDLYHCDQDDLEAKGQRMQQLKQLQTDMTSKFGAPVALRSITSIISCIKKKYMRALRLYRLADVEEKKSRKFQKAILNHDQNFYQHYSAWTGEKTDEFDSCEKSEHEHEDEQKQEQQEQEEHEDEDEDEDENENENENENKNKNQSKSKSKNKNKNKNENKNENEHGNQEDEDQDDEDQDDEDQEDDDQGEEHEEGNESNEYDDDLIEPPRKQARTDDNPTRAIYGSSAAQMRMAPITTNEKLSSWMAQKRSCPSDTSSEERLWSPTSYLPSISFAGIGIISSNNVRLELDRVTQDHKSIQTQIKQEESLRDVVAMRLEILYSENEEQERRMAELARKLNRLDTLEQHQQQCAEAILQQE